MAFLLDCCCFGLSGEELYRDWDNHPAVQQYSFIKRLGEGGFSEVQLAQDKLTGKQVALKIIFLNRKGLTSEQRRILAGEAKLIRMVAHPNIIRCMQVLETRRQQVLVLEHLSGGEMLQQLQRVKRYTEAHACQLFRQVADAVAYLHSLSIMHRDIKPENCLLAKPAQYYASKNKPCKVKLIDLGMAGLYRPDQLLYGCMGSPGFIAPEVILGDAHTPALDIYSLGVLLFVMLVGRKPWDAQRSYTLQYAIQATAEAPGLADPVFLALSKPARELLLWMLHEEPGRRPTAAQVLGHRWMLQAAQGLGVGPAASPERLIQPAVQQRLRMLGNSRQVMGTARGMLLLHSRGSRSGAVAFHRAVKEARLKLQQQAAALEASGQLQQLQQQAATAVEQLVSATATPAAPVPAVAAEPACTTAAAALAAQTAQQGVAVASLAAAPGASSTTSTFGVAGGGGAGTKPLDALPEKQTVGQLARQSLTRKSMLFDGRRPPLPSASSVPPASSGSTAAGEAHGSTAAAAGSYTAVQARNTSGAAAAAAGNLPVDVSSPDHALHCEALERGMSLPNPDFTPLTTSGYLPCSGRYWADHAVSVSPSALALLDADDRLCLLAAGTSADDGSDALFSWGARQGAADMVASFRHQYLMKPIIKSIARFGQSLSSSLSRSFRPIMLHSNSGRHSGRYMATAAAATEEVGPASVTGTQQCPGSIAAVARMLLISSDGDSSDTDSLLAGHAVDSGSQLLHDSGSCAHSAPASRGDSNGVGCKSPRLPSRLSVGVAGQTAAGGAAESSSRGTAVGPDGVLQPSAAAPHRSKPPLPTTVKQELTAAAAAAVSGRAAMRLGHPAGLSMQRSGSGGEDTLQGSAIAINSADDSALAGAHSAEHSIELAFLGTEFSMSPPALSPQTSAPGALATAASQGGAGSNEEETVLCRNDIRGKSSSSNPRRKHLQQYQQLQQHQLQWPGHVILAQPHLLPSIPSDTALSASAVASASHDSFVAVADDLAPSSRAAGSSIASRQYGTGQAGSQQQKPRPLQQQQQHLNRVTPFSNPSASAAAAGGIVVLADAVSPVPQLHKAPTHSRRSRDVSSGTAAASTAAGSMLPAAAGHHIRSVVNSPSMRAAATAAAAREEEEGLNLPNGLWLQQSQSVDSSFALSPAGPMLPTLSASSALQSALVGGDSSSLAHVEFQLQQAAEEPGEAAQGDLGASVVDISIPHGSNSAGTRNALESVATAAEADCTAAAEEVRAASQHRRDPSVLDWMVDADELQYAPGGARDTTFLHWLPQPPAAAVTAAADRQQQGLDMFASLTWLNRTSSDDHGGGMTLDPGLEGSGVATAIAASVAPRTRPFGSGMGAEHAIPMRAAAHRVAVSYQRQSSSSNRQKRRTVPYNRRFSGRRSGSMNASSGGGGAVALADSTTGGDVFSNAAVGTQPGLGVAEAAAKSGDLRALGVASSKEQHDIIDTAISQASGEFVDFYVGSFTDRQGLAAAGEQLWRSVSIDSIGSPTAAAGLAGLATAADVEGKGDLQMQASAADGDDSLLLGSVDLANQKNMCTCRDSIDGSSGGKAAAPPLPAAAAAAEEDIAADAKGGSSAGTPAGTAAASALAGSARSSDSINSIRSSTGSLSKRSKHAAALGQSKVAAVAAATVALYLEKQQYHQQQYIKQLQQQYSSTTAVTNRRSTGGPAAVAMAGGAWYFDANERSSRSGSSSSSSSEDSNALKAAAAPNSGEVVSGVAAAPPAAAVATSSGTPAFDAARHAGGVAWLVRGLSGKYHMPDEDIAAPEAAPGEGLVGARFRGLAARQQQQPTFDDFDEPAYYYVS